MRTHESTFAAPSGSIETARTLSTDTELGAGETKLPARIARFRVISRLGAGGMGEVYLASDDALERRIAIKRVRGASSASAQERLQREARALAQFSHDNIVQVYEIGEHEGCTFIAMEFIEGLTLGEWLREHPSSWEQICALFLAAGRGLAAAHAHAIVHRDFKPDNTLVRASDGRVKVADFGLVLDEFADPMDGLVVGTPRYMSPEQMRGQACDARSDQFSFCVALYEAIWGEHPFPARKFHERLLLISAGRPRPQTTHRALYRVLERGLADDPARRWSDMDELLAALERVRNTPRRRRRWALGGIGLAAALGLSALLSARLSEPSLRCEAELAGVWDASTRARLERHLRDLDARHAQASSERLLASLDRWASAWMSEQGRLCEQLAGATELELVQGSSVRASCLLRQRERVSKLVGALAEGDERTLAAGLVAAARLPEAADCERARADAAPEPPPPMLTATVDELRTRLEDAHTQRTLGRLDQAQAQVQAVLERASGLAYAPLEAEAKAELAKLTAERGEAQRAADIYDGAIRLAQSARHDQLAAELLLERVELSLQLPSDRSAELRLEQAQAALDRIGASDAQRARASFAAGSLAERAGDHALAKQRYEQAIERAAEDALELPYYSAALATVSASPEQRLQLRARALEQARERFGPHHPRTALFLYNHGLELLGAGDPSAAERELELAEQLWAENLVPTHKLRAKLEQREAMAALVRGELELAEQRALEAARILDELLPADDPERGEPASILAQVAAMRADLDPSARDTQREQAIFHAQRAIRLLEGRSSARGPDAELTRLHQLLGNQLMSLARYEQAEQAFVRASERSEDPRASAITSLRRAELALHRDALADAALQLDAAAPHVAELGAEGLNYALLRAVVELRLGRLGEAQLAELRAARREYPSMEPALGPWLDELGVSAEQRARLGI